MKKLSLIPALLMLAACGGKGDEIVFDTTVGPNTAAQVQSLPKTLEGDHANARYSSEAQPGQNMVSKDGSED
ncbi:MAG: hypothetical protein EP335_03775 [Alphaproteobacteria bacterium]|nr:MAG: hypothetical protein EP335_03775 [Alphaproteobacteria bacterium]